MSVNINANPIGIAMIGCGTVGGGVASLLKENSALYERRLGRKLELRAVLVRDVQKAKRSGKIDAQIVTDDVEKFFATKDVDIVVEAAGGAGVIKEYIQRAIGDGKHIVTANKSLLANQGADLFKLAKQNNVSISFEASCAGGIPCVTALCFGLMANNIDHLYGILNGTCNFILTQMTKEGKTYDSALTQAKELGYAEADPTLDVSGADAAQKLAILSSLAFGKNITEPKVYLKGIEGLDLADINFGIELGYDIKLLGVAQLENGKANLSMEPCFVPDNSLIAQVKGAYNALYISGDSVGKVMLYGEGAGEKPTASAVISDVLNVASGWYQQAFSNMSIFDFDGDKDEAVNKNSTQSRFYLRFNALDSPGVMSQITRLLGEYKISISSVMQHESCAGSFVPVVITTHSAKSDSIKSAVSDIAKLKDIKDDPKVIKIVDTK